MVFSVIVSFLLGFLPRTWGNYLKYTYPGIISNIEDILYRSHDKVSLYKQSSKVAVLTGGNRGIGVEVVKKLIACDITVVLGVRNPEASRKSVETFLGDAFDDRKVIIEKCDTGDFESVRNFAVKIQQKFKAIHLLINNAGIMYVPFVKTKDGFESQMAVNFLGHALLTHLLMPLLTAGSNDSNSNNSRIVNVSSCAHKCGEIDYKDINMEKLYDAGLQYGNSKLAQILFSNHVNRICREKGLKIQSNCVHPGVVDTELFNVDPIIGTFKIIRQLFFKSAERGSRTLVYAAIAPEIEGRGGTYLYNCRESNTLKLTNDENECKKFFEFTCELLKIKEFGSA